MPDFDDWGWDDYWSQVDWRTWHTAMANAYGLQYANDHFVNVWNSETDFWSEMGDVRADWVSIDSEFRAWAAGLVLSNGMTMLEALENSVLLSGVTGPVVEDIEETIENTSGIVSNTTNLLKWLIPIALIALLVLGGFIIYNKSNLLKI